MRSGSIFKNEYDYSPARSPEMKRLWAKQSTPGCCLAQLWGPRLVDNDWNGRPKSCALGQP